MKRKILSTVVVLLLAAIMVLPIHAAAGETSGSGTAASSGQVAYATISLENFEAATTVMVEFETPAGLVFMAEESQWLLEDGELQDIDAANSRAVFTYENAKDLNGEILKLGFRMPEYTGTKEYEVSYTVTVRNGEEAAIKATGSATLTINNPATAVTLSQDSLQFQLNGAMEATLTAYVQPNNTTDTVRWSTSNAAVATVDENGKVTGLKLGEATITVTVGSKSASCTVKVICVHDMTETRYQAPDCWNPGTKGYFTCGICQGIFEDKDGLKATTVEARKLTQTHDPKLVEAKAATCVKEGNVEYWICLQDCCKDRKYTDESCGQEMEDVSTAINPNNHTGQQTEVRDAAEPNCYQPGYTGDTWCLGCEVKLTSGTAVSATGNHVAATAWKSDENQHWHDCTTPGCTAQVGKKDHVYQWVLDEAATEDKTGLKHEQCVCGVKRSEGTVIPKLDHVHRGIVHHDAVAATCVKTGTVEYWTCADHKCSGKYYGDADCQLLLESIVAAIDDENHVGDTELRDKVEATCADKGYSGDTWCLSCKAMIQKGQEVPATQKHTPEADYQKDGDYHWQLCSVCDAIIGNNRVEHTYTRIVDKKPTEEETGSMHLACTVCGHAQEAVILEKLEHKPVLVEGYAATCENDGVAEHYLCENCGRYYASAEGVMGEEIKAEDIRIPSAHSFSTEWSADQTHHWHSCHCGAEQDKAEHSGETECEVCGYAMNAEQTPPTEDTTPPATEPEATEPEATTPAGTEPSDTEPGDEEGGLDWLLWLLLILLIGGGILLFVLGKRRKKK